MSSTLADPPPGRPPTVSADALDVAPPTDEPAVPSRRRWLGQATAMLGAGLLLAAVFAPWADVTRRGLHTAAARPSSATPTLGVVLVALAAVAAVGALAGDRGWPRLAAGVTAAALVIVHLDGWAAVEVPPGAWLALAGAVLELVAAAVATAAPARLRFGDLPRHDD